jgi:hypothetical protein
VPRRGILQLAKLVSLVLVVIGVAAGDVLVGVATAAMALGGRAHPLDAGPAVLAVAGGATAYLVLVTVLAHAVGTAARRSLPAVGGLLGYFFVVGPLVRDRFRFAAYLPDTAGYRLWFPGGVDTAGTSRTQSAAVLALWVLGSIVVAAIMFHRRDA